MQAALSVSKQPRRDVNADDRHLLPLKSAVRESAQIAVDQTVAVELRVGRQ
jgi:hypothetical protein